ncbi:MAG: TonB family protein, partial [Sphingobacteriales bacterium]
RIQFIVDKEGNIEDIEMVKSVEFTIDEEAMRLIRQSPQWAPAVQNGKKVKSYKIQPITFCLLNIPLFISSIKPSILSRPCFFTALVTKCWGKNCQVSLILA